MNEQQQQPNGDRMDRFERGLEHLLEAQARHADESAARFERLEREQVEFRTDLSQLLKAQVLVTDSQGKIVDAQGKLTDSHRLLDEKLAALAEAQRETTEKLNALIAVVDGLVKRPPQGA